MENSSSPTANKTNETRNFIAVICFIFLPIVGLILMWLIATWSKKTKIIITMLFIFVILIIPLVFSLVSREKSLTREREITRRNDIRKITGAMEIYYGEHDEYLTDTSYPDSIGNLILKTPTDPLGGNYGWINNIENSQGFCAYTKLEGGGYYVAAHCGNYDVAIEPTNLTDCCPF